MILKIFTFWRIGLFAITYLGAKAFPQVANGGLGAKNESQSFSYLLSWAQWDGGHYFEIAKNGYTDFTQYAFFPAYPVSIKVLDTLLPLNTLQTGLIISNICFLAFLYVFYHFLKKCYTSKTAINTLITFFCFPTTFFAVAFYTEGLFLLLAALFFYFLYQNKYQNAAIVIALASLTRFVGIFLILALFYKSFSAMKLKTFKVKNVLIPYAISFVGILTYIVYLAKTTNNPLAFLAAQSNWQRTSTDPISTIIGSIWTIATNPNTPPDQYLDVVVTVSFIGILIAGIKKIPSSLWIFSMLVVLVPASTGTLASMPRYALSSLGAFIIIGNFLEKYPKLKTPLWAFMLMLQAILAVKFVNGYWVA